MTFGKKSDIIIGLLFCAIAAYVYAEAAAMPPVRRGLSPGGYPIFGAVGLGFLGLCLVIQTLVRWKTTEKPLFSMEWKSMGRIFLFILMVLAYIQAIAPIGFVLASILFLFVAIYFFGYRRHAVNAAFSIATPLVIYYIFRHIFLVLIPTGYLFR